MTAMDRLLIIITRPDGQSEIGELWNEPYKKLVGDSMVWVINGRDIGLPGSRGWANGFNAITARPTFSDFRSIGVIYHRQDGKFTDGTNAATELSTSFPGVGDRHNAYSSGGVPERPEYVEHRALARAIEADPQSPTAGALFDHFWLTCFKDPILEDLILLLQTHERKKSEGEPIDDLEELRTAVANNGQGQAQGNGRAISNKAIELVSPRLTAGTGYDALRTALVESVVARYENPNA